MFKNVDKSMLMKLVLLHVVVITVSNALVAIPVEIFGVKLTWAAFTFPLVVIATDLTVRLMDTPPRLWLWLCVCPKVSQSSRSL